MTPAPGPPGRWSAPRLRDLAKSAGFTDSEAVTAAAIAMAESGGDPKAANPNSNARGLWQIMTTAHGDKIAGRDILSPQVNADVARKVYIEAGKKWTPWAVYNSGAYRKYIEAAGGTATDPLSAAGGAASDAVSDVIPDNPIPGAIARFGGQLEKWLNIAIAAQVAIALLVIGVVFLIAPTVIKKNVKQVPGVKALNR